MLNCMIKTVCVMSCMHRTYLLGASDRLPFPKIFFSNKFFNKLFSDYLDASEI